MSKTAPSPGPYIVDRSIGGELGLWDSDGNHLLLSEGNRLSRAKREANAAFLADAPLMAGYLESSLSYLELLRESNEEPSTGACSQIIRGIRKLLKKHRQIT